MSDRVKSGWSRFVNAIMKRVDRYAFYRARVVSQSADLTKLDVVPDDSRLPSFSAVPLRHGLPGVKVQVSAGAYVMLGFMAGDPRLPYVHCWEGGESATQIILKATTVYLGDSTGTDALVKKTEFNNHVHTGPSTTCVNGSPWTGSTAVPTTPATGTTKVQAA